MKIKVLEEKFTHGRDMFYRDEVRVVDDALGTLFVENGWAEDLDGNVATGDRNKSHGRTLEVQSGALGLTSMEVGHG